MIICTLTGKLVNLRIQIIPCNGVANGDSAKEDASRVASRKSSNTDSSVDSPTVLNSQMSNSSDTSTTSHTESQFSLDQQNNTGKCANTLKPANQVNSNLANQASQEADRLPKMSMARASHGVVAYEKKLYIIGGYDRGECLDLCEVYDPATNQMVSPQI